VRRGFLPPALPLPVYRKKLRFLWMSFFRVGQCETVREGPWHPSRGENGSTEDRELRKGRVGINPHLLREIRLVSPTIVEVARAAY